MSEKTSPFHELDHSVIGNISPDVAVTSWDNEKADYDYATDTCDPNSRFGCGHYTQVTIYIYVYISIIFRKQCQSVDYSVLYSGKNINQAFEW